MIERLVFINASTSTHTRKRIFAKQRSTTVSSEPVSFAVPLSGPGKIEVIILTACG
jgi:hypothetical protein